MASIEVDGIKILCAVCGSAAVKKRVYCSKCKIWMYNSCANKRGKRCCENQMLDAIIEDDRVEEQNDNELTDSIIEQSVAWENKVLKEILKEDSKT